MDNYMSLRMMWNWNTEEAKRDGSRFLAYIPGAKEGNQVQRVRWKQGEYTTHEGFFNDHGNEVNIGAFFNWTEPQEEQRILKAFEIDDPNGTELAEALEEVSISPLDKAEPATLSWLPAVAGVVAGAGILGIAAALLTVL